MHESEAPNQISRPLGFRFMDRTIPVGNLLAATLILLGLFFRFWGLDRFLGREFLSDENYSVIVHTYESLYRVGAIGSAWQTLPRFFDLVFTIGGLSELNARLGTVFLSVFGLFGWFLFLDLTSSRRMALWSTGFLSVSLHATYFSRLALEPIWVLALFPWCFFFLEKCSSTSFIWAFPFAVSVLIGIFTYPGFSIAAAAITLTVFFWCVSRRQVPRPLAIAGLLTVICILGSLSYWWLKWGIEPLRYYGGGALDLSAVGIVEAAAAISRDAFFKTSSWILPFETSFFEMSLFPLALIGLGSKLSERTAEAKGAPSAHCLLPWAHIFVGTSFFVYISIHVTGAYPGMRRGIFLLLPFYFFCGAGADALIARWVAKRWLSLLVVLIVFAMAGPVIVFQTIRVPGRTNYNYGTGLGQKKVPNDYLQEALLTGDLLLDRREFGGPFEEAYYEAYISLARRYGLLSPSGHTVRFIDSKFFVNRTFTSPTWTILTRNSGLLSQVGSNVNLRKNVFPDGWISLMEK